MHSVPRYKPLFLLAFLVIGWVAAPIVHQLEHAARWAAQEHAHDRAGLDGSWETGCNEEGRSIEECQACLTRVAPKTHVDGVPCADAAFVNLPGSQNEETTSRDLRTRGARGPPSWM